MSKGLIMRLIDWFKIRVTKLTWYDIGLIKGAVISLTLMLVILWPFIGSLNWRWYLLFTIAFAARPFWAFHFKK